MRKIVACLFYLTPLLCVAQVDQRSPGKVVVANTATTGTTYALVVGISSYKDVKSLNYAHKDAAVFAEYLLAKSGMGLDSSHVKVLLNDDATRNKINNAFSDITKKGVLKEGDKVIFFFAGHGDIDDDTLNERDAEALLLCYESPLKNYFDSSFLPVGVIPTSDLDRNFIQKINKRGASLLLIIDACHSSGLSGGKTGAKRTLVALEGLSGSQLYSCKSDQTSAESKEYGGGRGLFSFVLMEGLYGMADIDSSKSVTFDELQRYVMDNVKKLSNKAQTPIIKPIDPEQAVTKVNDSLLMNYLLNKSKGIYTMAANIKRSTEDAWTNEMDSTQKRLYDECNDLIKMNKPGQAYEKFLLLNQKDSTSNAVIDLRRNLSVAFQEKTAKILAPMVEDVYNFRPDKTVLGNAVDEMVIAGKLLGEDHFFYPNVQGRILFLKALIIKIGRDTSETKVKEAIEYLEQSVLLEPNAPYTYFYLGYFYRIKKNDLEKAMANYRKYLSLIPNSCWANNAIGNVYRDMKNYPDAITHIRKAVAIKPDYSNAWNNLGNVYYDMKEYDSAVTNYGRAIALKANYTLAWYGMGTAYHDFKKYDSAISAFKKVIEQKPDFSHYYSYYLTCTAYSLNGNIDSAYAYLDQVVQLIKQNKINANLDYIMYDDELKNLRANAGFKSFMKKYFSEAELKKYD